MATPKTLADLTYMVAVELKAVREGTVTTAGLTSFVDSYRTESDDYWNRGGFWIRSTPSGSAPQGYHGVVSDFASGGTVTPRSMPATVPVASTYALGRRRYPLDVIVAQVNSAYRRLGTIPQSDITSLTTDANTTEYTLPDAAMKDLREVWLETNSGDTDDPGWVKIPYGMWREEVGKLYLPKLTSGYIIKLVYMDEPADLVSYTDTISEYVHPKRIVYKATAGVLEWRAERLGDQQAQSLINRINAFLDEDQRAEYNHPIHIPVRGNKLFISNWNRSSRIVDDEAFLDVV